VLATAVFAGALSSAGTALAQAAPDNPGRLGEIGGPPGSVVSETAKEPASVPSQYGGKSPGQFVSSGTAPGDGGGGGGEGPGT